MNFCRKRAYSLWTAFSWALTAIRASCSSVVPYSSIRWVQSMPQKAGPGMPTEICRRYSGSVSSSTAAVWIMPFGIFSAPNTSTLSYNPLATRV